MVRAAHFACRISSSPFAPPQDCRASSQPLESWAGPQGLYPELRLKFLTAPSLLGASALSWTALFFPESRGGPGLLLVTMNLLTLSVTFRINGTKKLQRAAKQKTEAKERSLNNYSFAFGGPKGQILRNSWNGDEDLKLEHKRNILKLGLVTLW